MSVTVVVGGQYGSEAKGKVVAHIAKTDGAAMCIRTGGPNAGHTCYPGGQKHITRQLPSALAVPGVLLAIGAGGMVDVELLNRELRDLMMMQWNVMDRLVIDRFAAIVNSDAAKLEENVFGLGSKLGSTQTGTGFTQSQRIMRQALVASHIPELARFHGDVAAHANHLLDQRRLVIVEGTQGFGLSMLHGQHYPFCTSRDTSASGFLSEAGLAPSTCDRVIMVMRTYPIRVGGNSGPIKHEIDWATIRKRSGYPHDLTEMTSVTKKVRRVGEWDWELAYRAAMVNRPTDIAIHGLDYLNYGDYGKTQYEELSDLSKEFIDSVENLLKVPVTFAFTGPHQDHLIDRRYHGMRPKPGQPPVHRWRDGLHREGSR
jgi:adenylosuccinate synthase